MPGKSARSSQRASSARATTASASMPTGVRRRGCRPGRRRCRDHPRRPARDLPPLLGPGGVLGLAASPGSRARVLVDPWAVLRAPLRTFRRTRLRTRSRCLLAVGPAAPGRMRSVLLQRAGLVHRGAAALLAATSYWGSSLLALTVRPDASVSEVIFRSTVPSAVPPWLFQVTWSPFFSSSAIGPPRRRGRCCPARARPGPAHTHSVRITRSGTDLLLRAVADAHSSRSVDVDGGSIASTLLGEGQRLPSVRLAPVPRSPARSTPIPPGSAGSAHSQAAAATIPLDEVCGRSTC